MIEVLKLFILPGIIGGVFGFQMNNSPILNIIGLVAFWAYIFVSGIK